MKLTRARAVLAAGLLTAAAAASPIVLTAGPASAGPSQVGVAACHGHGQVRPARAGALWWPVPTATHTA